MSEQVETPEGAPLSEFASAGEALVAVAAQHGTDVIFGLVSIHNQPLVEAAQHGARYVPVRHEAAAVNAADAYARVTGNLGVALTSTGTGAGNAAGSLIEALTAGSSVLHVTGQIDAEYLGHGRGVIHETKDQYSMLDAVSKSTSTVVDSASSGQILETGAQASLSAPFGPVSIEIPIDLQYLPTTMRPVAKDTPVPIDPDAVRAAADLIAQAERPALWLGGGSVLARDSIGELVKRLGAAVFTSNAGRGTIDERDEMVIGNFAASVAGAELLADADLLISIGTHFRSNETRHYKLPMPTQHVQLDIDPAAIGRVHPASVGVVGDADGCVLAILEALGEGSGDTSWTARVIAARNEARLTLRNEIGPYAELCDAMRSTMHERSPFVRDVTIPASAWGNRLLDVYEPATNINPRGGGIGQGLAMALGASVARPEVPTFLMVGDGGLAVHLGELASVAQESPWLVIVLFNDLGYGVLRNLQDAHFGRRSGVDLTTPNFALLAESVGISHRVLKSPGDSEAVLADGVAAGGPVIVEVDCISFGEMTVPFVPPVPVQR